jgi:hypothetical protein
MKCSFLALIVTIAAFAVVPKAYANQENVPTISGKRYQADVLRTEPATINRRWNNTTNQTSNINQNNNSISVVRDQECQNVNPLEFIKNPDAFLKRCQKQTNERVPQRSFEPIEYFKVPKLDSGINVTVTQF